MLLVLPLWLIPTPVQARSYAQFPYQAVEEVAIPSLEQLPREVIQPTNDQPIQEAKSIPKTATDNSPKPVPTGSKAGRTTESRKSVRQTNNLQPAGDIQIAMKDKVVTKWGEEYWSGMKYLLDHESDSNPHAVNPKSGACGIPQAYPCSKLLKVIGSLDNVDGQLDWMVNYVAQRYGDPIKAQAFHQKNNWY